MQVEIEREEDGRWIAEVPVLRGAMAYGATRKEAVAKVEALVLGCWPASPDIPDCVPKTFERLPAQSQSI